MIDIESLRTALKAASYTYDDAVDALGNAAHEALAHNTTVLGEVALHGRTDPLSTLTRLFMLQLPVPLDAAREALGDNIEHLTALHADVPGPDASTMHEPHVRAKLAVRPYASPDDDASGWIVADLIPGLDQAPIDIRPDFVLGPSPASTSLVQLTSPRHVGSALDLGTGCGVQSLHLARHADRVVATDLNPRALELARLTFALNEIDVDTRLGSLFEPVADERFDLIVSNPPFVMSPPSDDAPLMYRESSLRGDELVRQVIVDGAARLNPGGTLNVLANWAHTGDQPWIERLHGWAEATGCTAYICERERLGLDDYVRMWLSDAGLDTSPDYRQHYRHWIDYLQSCQIDAVSFGWLNLRHTDGAGRITVESWPHLVQQPVGPAVDELLDAMSDVAAHSDDDFLAGHWEVADDVDVETIADPGAEDPRHIVLRQRTGLCRAIEMDTALAAVVGAADGDLSLAQLIDAVAGLLDVDPEALRGELLPQLRQLATDGLLLKP